MVNTCSVVFCKTGYKKRDAKQDSIPEKHPVFGFPKNRTGLYEKWIKFVNRIFWVPSNNSGICCKHFDAKYLKVGGRTTLKWDLDPVPTIYSKSQDIPTSLLPTISTTR